jgi:hypothetical protein
MPHADASHGQISTFNRPDAVNGKGLRLLAR